MENEIEHTSITGRKSSYDDVKSHNGTTLWCPTPPPPHRDKVKDKDEKKKKKKKDKKQDKKSKKEKKEKKESKKKKRRIEMADIYHEELGTEGVKRNNNDDDEGNKRRCVERNVSPKMIGKNYFDDTNDFDVPLTAREEEKRKIRKVRINESFFFVWCISSFLPFFFC